MRTTRCVYSDVVCVAVCGVIKLPNRMAEDEGGAEGDDDMMVGDDDMMSDGGVQSESGDDDSAEGAAAIGVMDDNEVVGHDMVTGATDVGGGGVRGGAKRSRGTDDEAEGHEAEDGEEGGYREAGESVRGAAGGGMMRDSADQADTQERWMSTNGEAKSKRSRESADMSGSTAAEGAQEVGRRKGRRSQKQKNHSVRQHDERRERGSVG